MANARRLTWLTTLALFFTTVSIVGHFASDAICVGLNAVDGYNCSSDELGNGRFDSPSSITADLHGNFDLPTELPTLSLIAQAFILVVATLAYFPYSPTPTSPPPKPLS